MKDDLINRVELAKQNNQELEQLIKDYLPFIKKKMSETTNEDMLTISMLAFSISVKQYEADRGSFLSYAALNIRCRILDELKKENRYFSNVIPIHSASPEENSVSPAELELSQKSYNRELERRTLADEIKYLSEELSGYDIRFSDLPKICPKQKKTRDMCISMAKNIIMNDELRNNLIKSRRLPQSKLSELFLVSVKTIEKHRKYIMTLVILLLGDYPNIKTFIPAYREVVI